MAIGSKKSTPAPAAVLDTLRELNLSEQHARPLHQRQRPLADPGQATAASPARCAAARAAPMKAACASRPSPGGPATSPPAPPAMPSPANIDLLPTFVNLAGGTVPTDRKIDGVDISPLLLGQTKESPRKVQYYFDGNQLQAVRVGPWKMAIAPQREQNKPEGQQEKPSQPPFPKLYNLDTDIGETTDVASQHPDVIKQLQEYVATMDKDLGKGQRPRSAGAGESRSAQTVADESVIFAFPVNWVRSYPWKTDA